MTGSCVGARSEGPRYVGGVATGLRLKMLTGAA